MLTVAAINNIHCRKFEAIKGIVYIYLKLNKFVYNNNIIII
jgi:hypothetical protein